MRGEQVEDGPLFGLLAQPDHARSVARRAIYEATAPAAPCGAAERPTRGKVPSSSRTAYRGARARHERASKHHIGTERIMATSAAGQLPAARSPGLGAGRIAALVAASFAALIALALLVCGALLVGAHATQRDGDGFYNSETQRLTTATPALTAEGLHLGDVDGGGGDWVVETIDATVRINAVATDAQPLFVGIARERDLDAYLRGVAHDEVRHVERDDVSTRSRPGGTEVAAPTRERFWVASASGPGPQTLEWKADGGDWAAVVMNADGSPRVAADVSVGARTGLLLPVGIALLVAGVLVGAAAGVTAWLAVRRTGEAGSSGTPLPVGSAPTAPGSATMDQAAPYPVAVEARIDEPLSRWLWLVKWFLAIPHWIALAFLWAAFVLLSLVAIVAVAVTGRYPRSIFGFNVGVMRWSWRVGFYATSAMGTDRYPPFTLARADYPAELEVPYPERLSRGKALVKWWLLALPHYAILAGLYGAWNATWTWGDANFQPPGVITVLVLVAGVSLAVTGRYPREVFRLVVGINRWLYRVIAYAAGMRDEYPPFRLER
ncbi:MAG TPA: DUF4389 domain-containing protein [Solirubrobacteraceae bacterium]|nr:DUF4389 domain-containing protein [Solirubrobacteraceae bacterium]